MSEYYDVSRIARKNYDKIRLKQYYQRIDNMAPPASCHMIDSDILKDFQVINLPVTTTTCETDSGWFYKVCGFVLCSLKIKII